MEGQPTYPTGKEPTVDYIVFAGIRKLGKPPVKGYHPNNPDLE